MRKSIGLGDKSPDQQPARQIKQAEPEILQPSSPVGPHLNIDSEQYVEKSAIKDVDMARAHQQAQLLRDNIFVGEIGAHELAGHQEDDKQNYSRD